MRVIIAGSRTIIDQKVVLRAIRIANQIIPTVEIDEVLSGCAQGVDFIGEAWGHDSGLVVRRFPADWNKWGKAAGFRRNAEMAKQADALIAVWDGKSKGTKHMIDHAIGEGLIVYIHGTAGLKHHPEGYTGPCSCQKCVKE